MYKLVVNIKIKLAVLRFKAVAAEYVWSSLIYGISGYISYGVIPLLCSYVGLTNNEFQEKKEQKLIRKSKIYQDDVFNEITENEKEEDRYLSS